MAGRKPRMAGREAPPYEGLDDEDWTRIGVYREAT
jgi:hypothetical protein